MFCSLELSANNDKQISFVSLGMIVILQQIGYQRSPVVDYLSNLGLVVLKDYSYKTLRLD